MLRQLIERYRWWWFLKATDELALVDPATFGTWKVAHLDDTPVWYNRVMSFAQDRALRLGLYVELLGDAPTVECARCEAKFLEPEGRGWDLQYRADICNDCIRACIWEARIENRASKAFIKTWVAGLAEIGGRVPSKGYGSRASDLGPLSTRDRVRLLDHVAHRPGDGVIKQRFGGWLQALIASGVLADGTWKTTRGTRTVAAVATCASRSARRRSTISSRPMGWRTNANRAIPSEGTGATSLSGLLSSSTLASQAMRITTRRLSTSGGSATKRA